MKSIDQKPIIWLEGLPEAPQRHPGRVWGWVDGFRGRSDRSDHADHDSRYKNDRLKRDLNCDWILAFLSVSLGSIRFGPQWIANMSQMGHKTHVVIVERTIDSRTRTHQQSKLILMNLRILLQLNPSLTKIILVIQHDDGYSLRFSHHDCFLFRSVCYAWTAL